MSADLLSYMRAVKQLEDDLYVCENAIQDAETKKHSHIQRANTTTPVKIQYPAEPETISYPYHSTQYTKNYPTKPVKKDSPKPPNQPEYKKIKIKDLFKSGLNVITTVII